MGAKVEQIAKYVLNENNQFWECIAAKCQGSRDSAGPALVSSPLSQQNGTDSNDPTRIEMKNGLEMHKQGRDVVQREREREKKRLTLSNR